MKLYHGTSDRHLDSILANGLIPRGRRRTNWDKRTGASLNDLVYLTSDKAASYAANSLGTDDDRCLIVEINPNCLDQNLFFPDEDYLALYHAPPGIKHRLQWGRRRVYRMQEQWKDSLEQMGNIAYMGVIPPSAITRIARVKELKGFALWEIAGSDFHISNYQHILYLMNDQPKIRDVCRREYSDLRKGLPGELAERPRARIQAWKELLRELPSDIILVNP